MPKDTPPPTRTLLQQQLRVLAVAVPLAALGDGDAVHRARVASRRLREILPVAAKSEALGPLNRQIRRLTRALGPVRELDVTLALVADAARRRMVTPRAARLLKRALVEARAGARRQMARQLADLDLERLAGLIESAGRSRPRLRTAAARLARRAAQVEAGVKLASGLYVPERLHAVRITVKKLRYAEEVLRLVRGETTGGTRLRQLKRVQDTLGRMHDLEVLIGTIRHVQATSAPPLGVSEDLDAYVRALDGECRQLHGQYMRGRDRLVELCRSRPAGA